ncbi:hypothetical protein CIHG_07341 [Coccidioides immitis H538.4]|uniref:HhH-GPD domain-containing protein n=2 Tax=Coccidioides immitis TaxID=5501 RepID=A0A0J8RZG2_COCIT|nr:hypothetical protein CIRG_00671 [Coccidioides immitis RMSCC 2394]KMU89534.1 hypothetical protein CIHG_07341 [Coccidioides immitis H538.4]
MVRTRAQERAEASSAQKQVKAEEHVPPKELVAEKKHMQKPKKRTKKHEIPEAEKATKPLSEAARKDIQQLLTEQGSFPLQEIGFSFPLSSSSATVLALLFEALLKAAPISHKTADETLKELLKHGYEDINVLKNSSWDERSDVLIEGGYRHYYKKTSSELGELAEWAMDKYNGDLNNLYKQTAGSRAEIRTAIKHIKGIGDVAVDIFLSSIQSFWPEVAPFIAERSLVTADHIGIGKDVEAIYEAVGRDPKQMCMLARALTKIRLEKEEAGYTVHESGK